MIEPTKIKFSKRRKYLSISISINGEIIVKAPIWFTEGEIYQYLEKNKNWIQKKLRLVESEREKIIKHTFTEGEEFLFLGKKFRLKFVEPDFCYIDVNNLITLKEDRLIVNEIAKRSIAKIIKDFYKRKALEILEERVKYYLNEYETIFKENLTYNKIQIKENSKVLGSCSRKGNLNFSWRIIQAPLDVIDYLVVHEITHLKHRNHKIFFWSTVARLKPFYKSDIEWLRNNWLAINQFLRD